MEILLLTGSPRKDGNSAALAAAFTNGAKSVGHQVVTVDTAQLNIGACRACGYCHSHGGICLQHDDMNQIYSHWQSAEMIVFATPLYYFNFSAQIKTAIDRFYANGGPLKKNTSIKNAVLLVSCGGAADSVSAALVATYNAILKYLEWQNCGIVIADNVYNVGEIENHPALLSAEQLGKSL